MTLTSYGSGPTFMVISIFIARTVAAHWMYFLTEFIRDTCRPTHSSERVVVATRSFTCILGPKCATFSRVLRRVAVMLVGFVSHRRTVGAVVLHSVYRPGDGLDDRGNVVRFQAEARDSPSAQIAQTSLGGRASYSVGSGGFFSAGKAAGSWNWSPTTV